MAVNPAAPYRIVGIDFSLVAGADLSGHNYCCAKLDGDGHVVSGSAVTDVIIGAIQNDPEEGQEVLIGTFGIYPMKAGAAFAEGTLLTCEAAATGRVVASAGDGDWIVGVALGEAGAANEVIPVLVGFGGRR